MGSSLILPPPLTKNRGCGYIPDIDAFNAGAFRFYTSAPDLDIYPDLSSCPLMDFGSVAHCALHFALWTHPKKIYLVGLDSTTNGSFNNHQHEPLVLNRVMDGYNRILVFIKTYYPDIEIISVNPVGLKGMFRDVYTKEYIAEHPDLQTQNIEILD